MPTADLISVSVPARAEFLHVFRAVVTGVAARMDFPYDSIDDLRIAVDEACAHLLRAGAPASFLTLRITSSSGELDIEARSDARPPAWPPPGFEGSLTWQILSALTDDARFERVDEAPALRFTKRIATA